METLTRLNVRDLSPRNFSCTSITFRYSTRPTSCSPLTLHISDKPHRLAFGEFSGSHVEPIRPTLVAKAIASDELRKTEFGVQRLLSGRDIKADVGAWISRLMAHNCILKGWVGHLRLRIERQKTLQGRLHITTSKQFRHA